MNDASDGVPPSDQALSASPTPATERPPASQWWAFGAWSIFAAVLLFCATVPLPSPDIWWQLAGGRQMLAQHVFPRTDMFSFTAGSAPWLNHEWLAECFAYGLYEHGGLGALHAAQIVMLMCVFWLVARVGMLDGATSCAAALAASLGILNAQWRAFLDIRPYLFTYLGVAITFYFATRYLHEGRIRWLLPLVPTYLLWANLHSGLIVGLALMGLCALGAMRRAPALSLRLLAATGVLALVAMINPYGSHVLTFPFDFIGHDDVWQRGLNEWSRTDFREHWPFFSFLAFSWLCAGVACRRGQREVGSLLVLGGFSILACSAWRHLTLCAIVAVPYLASGLTIMLAPLQSAVPRASSWVGGLLGGAACIALLWRASTVNLASLSLEDALFPVHAVAFLQHNPLPGRLLNPYGWGGYLDFQTDGRYRVFMDGRANTLFPAQVYEDYLKLGQGRPGWEKLAKRYDVQLIMISRWEVGVGIPTLTDALARSPDWTRIYIDDLADVWIRRDLLPSGTKLWLPPEGQLGLARIEALNGHLARARSALDDLIAHHQLEAEACSVLALVEIRAGHPQAAEDLLRRALVLDATLVDAHYSLGALLLARGDRAGAIVQLEQELNAHPDDAAARAQLEKLGAP